MLGHRVNAAGKQVVIFGLLCAVLTARSRPVLAGVTVWDEVPPTETAPAAQRTATYPELLSTGDEYRAAGKFSLALTEYATALTQAANDTERALAMAKEGMIYVYDQTNYAAARHTVDAALQLNNVQPVALVTLLEVQA